ncbi:uncharacterized protein GIQ15_02307 [Arthroderma uncinatum]|uniref:uncharacterized protein n=1 Tax=Arthroderma uncinatum TaxID=74035 RepID=UPI00144AE7C4|nr:uncharacterized protein GIQ15_02307 [Arthroderma uncinatum]KAF3482983.1 hypothetical protein GIQ15_02307 [Arthroderma uncinatum]
MTILREIKYSRQDCIAAVRDYYQFLAMMYLDENLVLEPPEGGWPSITDEAMLAIGKDKTVASLLRHLPYLARPTTFGSESEPIPFLFCANWAHNCAQIKAGRLKAEGVRDTSQACMDAERVPPHVVGLTSGGRDTSAVLLDTKLGVIFFPKCHGDIMVDPYREGVLDNLYNYAPENEADWRASGGCWAITDFFEVLKHEFRKLSFVPLNTRIVLEIYSAKLEEVIPMVQEIY